MGFVDHHVGEAVHRLDAETLLVNLGEIHVLAVVLVMPGALPQFRLEYLGTNDNVVTALEMFFTFEIFKYGAQHGPFGMPYGKAGANFIGKGKQVQLFPQLAMIAALCLLDTVQISFQLFFIGKGRSVDALQHAIFFVASPVGASYGKKLERLYTRSGRQMRTAAKIGKITLTVYRDRIHTQVVNQLGLVGFSHIGEHLYCICAGQDLTGNLQVSLSKLGHLCLNTLQVFRRKGRIHIKIVVEAILDGRTNRHLCLGEKFLNRMGHQVGG